MHSDAMRDNARREQYLPPTIEVGSGARAEQQSGKFVRVSQLRKLRQCEQVAAVCYRVRRESIEFLLVQTRGSGRWTFPKGSTEPGLTHAQAAAMEAFEEAGVHGRIEETSFARYVRRPRGSPNCGLKSGADSLAVKAYLCQVLRLSVPKESNRNRTWYSLESARQRLKEGRNTAEGAGLVRVLNLALERIQQLRTGTRVAGEAREDGYEKAQPGRLSNKKDPLQRVKFEFAEVYGRTGESTVLSRPGQSGAVRQSILSVAGGYGPPALRGDILEFDVSRKKKVKALGTGSNHR
jgi:ADP-ribose pyrophosphatase YjhB (NUDIX family)